jgi:hypothetical protein
MINLSRDVSDTSCGEYATPINKICSSNMKDSVSSSKFSGSETSLDQNSDYVFLQVYFKKIVTKHYLNVIRVHLWSTENVIFVLKFHICLQY